MKVSDDVKKENTSTKDYAEDGIARDESGNPLPNTGVMVFGKERR